MTHVTLNQDGGVGAASDPTAEGRRRQVRLLGDHDAPPPPASTNGRRASRADARGGYPPHPSRAVGLSTLGLTLLTLVTVAVGTASAWAVGNLTSPPSASTPRVLWVGPAADGDRDPVHHPSREGTNRPTPTTDPATGLHSAAGDGHHRRPGSSGPASTSSGSSGSASGPSRSGATRGSGSGSGAAGTGSSGPDRSSSSGRGSTAGGGGASGTDDTAVDDRLSAQPEPSGSPAPSSAAPTSGPTPTDEATGPEPESGRSGHGGG